MAGRATQIRLGQEALSFSQRLQAALSGKIVKTIHEHVQNVFAAGELPSEATLRKFRRVQTEGSREVGWLVDHSSPDVVIAAFTVLGSTWPFQGHRSGEPSVRGLRGEAPLTPG